MLASEVVYSIYLKKQANERNTGFGKTSWRLFHTCVPRALYRSILHKHSEQMILLSINGIYILILQHHTDFVLPSNVNYKKTTNQQSLWTEET